MKACALRHTLAELAVALHESGVLSGRVEMVSLPQLIGIAALQGQSRHAWQHPNASVRTGLEEVVQELTTSQILQAQQNSVRE